MRLPPIRHAEVLIVFAASIAVAMCVTLTQAAAQEDKAATEALKRQYNVLPAESAAPAPRAADASGWAISRYTSPIDDSPEVYAELVPNSGGDQDVGAIVKLMAFCKDHRSGLILQARSFWGLPIEAEGYAVTLRIDGGAARHQVWRQATSADAAFYLGDVGTFLRNLDDKQTLFVRLVDALGREHEASFAVGGAAEAARAVGDTCSAVKTKRNR
jgi:hypothetical protein